MKRWFLGFLLIFFSAGLAFFFSSRVFPEEAKVPELAPLNEEFLEYILRPKKEIWPQFSDDGHPLGLLPSPQDFSHFENLPVMKIESLPASYDLRAKDKLTAIRNQGACGSCWAFATYGSLESFLRPSETWDFSEQDLIDHHGFDYTPCSGGNIFMSTAYLARWSGPLNEKDVPYIYSAWDSFAVRKHIQDVVLIPPKPTALDNDLLKQAVMDYGALYVSMYYKSSYFNSDYNSYYNPSEKVGAHAVAIVGWDDNFDKTKFNTLPPENGAFIARNSWGTNWGEAGYFYVSYYDQFFGRWGSSAAVKAEPAVGYTVVYQYDPLGWISSLGYTGSDTAWFANIFTASSSDPVIAISFYSAGSSSSYEIYIYTNPGPDQPRSGTLAGMEIGSLNSPGYFTILLKVGIAFKIEQKFSVVVKQKTLNYNYPIPIEYRSSGYTSQASAQAGESFISSDGNTWKDLHTSWDGRYANSNVCLKAFSGLPPLYPPSNFKLQRLENNFIFFTEFINRLTWEANPKNRTKIIKYNLYQKKKDASDSTYKLISEIDPNVFLSDRRGLQWDWFYTYRITTVDELGRESEPSEASN